MIKEGVNKSKKIDKKDSLLNSAMVLFKKKGITNTTVADIAKGAGTAKGTFYLYFKDKNEIINTIILNETTNLLNDALNKSKALKDASQSDKVIFVVDYLIQAFENNREYVDLIHKNLYTGLFVRSDNSLVSKAVKEFIESGNSDDIKKSEMKLYIIVEMVGGVCYNSIMNSHPYKLDEIKEQLFSSIRSIINA